MVGGASKAEKSCVCRTLYIIHKWKWQKGYSRKITVKTLLNVHVLVKRKSLSIVHGWNIRQQCRTKSRVAQTVFALIGKSTYRPDTRGNGNKKPPTLLSPWKRSCASACRCHVSTAKSARCAATRRSHVLDVSRTTWLISVSMWSLRG